MQVTKKVSRVLRTLMLDSDHFRASRVGEVRRVKAEFCQGFVLSAWRVFWEGLVKHPPSIF